MLSIDQIAETRTLSVGILLFDEVEVLDFAGPFEVFSVAARIGVQQGFARHRPFDVSTVSATTEPVIARHGLQVSAHCHFANAPDFDVLIVPGGVVSAPLNDPQTLSWVQRGSKAACLTASVCTGAFILAEAGLLSGRPATTHWEDIADLRAAYPDVSVCEEVAFVDDGDVISSAGISAGIKMSLHIVERILGKDAAAKTARQMQYDWP